jgi:hypothetical protein
VPPGDVLSLNVRVLLSGLDQKRVAESVKSGIRIECNLIIGKLFPQTIHFRFERRGLEFLVGIARLARLGELDPWRRPTAAGTVVKEW